MTSTEPLPRNTWQRAAIRQHLSSTPDFNTAQQIHEDLSREGDRVGLATVYRALQSMSTAGEVDTIRTPEGELAYRSCSSGHHHHLICRNCSFAVELTAEGIEDWAAAVGREHGFSDVGHEVELYGLCAECTAAGVGSSKE